MYNLPSMKLMNSIQVAESISYSAGYTHGCSIMMVRRKHKIIPEKEKLHYHYKDSEHFYVLDGALTINVNGKDIIVEKG